MSEIETHLTKSDALANASKILKILNGLAEEDFIAEGFVTELLVFPNGDGFSVDIGEIIYTLNEMGERQLALDFEAELERLNIHG